MKKFSIILFIIVGVMLLLGVIAWLRLPSIVTFLLGRAIGGRVEAGQSIISWKGTTAVVELRDVKLSGDVQGNLKRVRLDVRPGRGIYIRYASLSDFDVVIKKDGTGGRFLPFQLEYAEVDRGRAVYRGQTFTINTIRIRNFNTAGQFEFSIDGGVEGFGKIKTHGSGIWRDGHSDISGPYEIADFDLSRLFRRYEGRSDSQGQFTYRAGELGLHGKAGADRFVMRENFLKKPLEVTRVDCTIDIETNKGRIDTKLGRLSFKGTPLHLAFGTTGRRLDRLEMASGPLDVRDLQEYLSLSFVKRLPDVMNAVSAGRLSIQEFVYAKPDTFKASLSLENLVALYKEVRFEGIRGDLRLDRDRLVMTGLTARLGNSLFSGVSGSVPFSEKRDFNLSGGYDLDLADIAHFFKKGGAKITSGSAKGLAEIRGKNENDLRIEGAGTVKDAALTWKNLPFTASGNYTFDRRGINCAPFIMEKGETYLVARGRMARDLTDLKIEGKIDAADAAGLFSFPYPLEGSAGVEGRIEGKGESLSWEGAVNMDALFFDIPGFMRKKVGASSLATLKMRWEGGQFYIDDLRYSLLGAHVHVKGTVDRSRVSNLKMKVEAPDLGQISSDLTPAKGARVRGEARADLEVRNLAYPLVRLPSIAGYATVKNGYLQLPFLPKPLDKMDLTCHFMGDRHELGLTDLRTGDSAAKMIRLVMEGIERPRISLFVRADNFNMGDVISKGSEPWRLHTIRPDSPLLNIYGDIDIQARRVQWDQVNLDGLHAKLSFAHGKLSLHDAGAGIFGGVAQADGSADFSGKKPRFGIAGGIDRIAWREVFKAVKGDADIMQGRGGARVNLQSEGGTAREITGNLSGGINANSKDGAIRKWNLLSKIFGLLNLYDLFQGKVNLAEEGLPYRTMSADFNGKDGLFKTRSFVIDSPSMYISGRGAITLPEATVEGTISVSPFVTVDTILSKIPVVRNVLREKKKGFFFVDYNVSGPLTDPSIYSTYVESLPMRAYMILRNLIKLPKEVMQ